MKSNKKILAALALVVGGAISALPSTALAAKPPVYTSAFSKIAADGYDVVAYFTEKKPVKGAPGFVATYKGATFQFANAANLATFKASPAAFAPQYGGYCAWAVAQGYTAKGDPRFWKVVDGKLYLNYNGDVQTKWNKDVSGFIRAGNTNWPTVLTK